MATAESKATAKDHQRLKHNLELIQKNIYSRRAFGCTGYLNQHMDQQDERTLEAVQL